MKVLDYFEEIILFIAFAAMTVITFLNVVSRNLAGISISFTEEITINLLVLITFLGAAVGVRKYAHLGFTLLFDKGNKAIRLFIVFFTGMMGFILFGILFWYGVEMVQFQIKMNQKTPALGMPQWILSLALPFGAFMCVVRTVQVVMEEAKNVSRGEKTVEGDDQTV
ncbi:TRAP transporter small permease [Lysinibacillus sp. KU-BSD001]|uniref:TRAP transporter small permease n=1 Tax=Lysinibacillus sp. KU-BSD001 TaxID=3141328 RepID=UPI0036E2469E